MLRCRPALPTFLQQLACRCVHSAWPRLPQFGPSANTNAAAGQLVDKHTEFDYFLPEDFVDVAATAAVPKKRFALGKKNLPPAWRRTLFVVV